MVYVEAGSVSNQAVLGAVRLRLVGGKEDSSGRVGWRGSARRVNNGKKTKKSVMRAGVLNY